MIYEATNIEILCCFMLICRKFFLHDTSAQYQEDGFFLRKCLLSAYMVMAIAVKMKNIRLLFMRFSRAVLMPKPKQATATITHSISRK